MTLFASSTASLGRLFVGIVSVDDLSRYDKMVAPDYVTRNAFTELGPRGAKPIFSTILACPSYRGRLR